MKTYIVEIEGGEKAFVGGKTYEEALGTAKEYIRNFYEENDMRFEVREAETGAAEKIQDATADVMQLLLEKNRKYGDNNLTRHGHMGIIVRLSDKLSRLENLQGTEHEEAIEDVYKDIAGYGILGLKLMKEGRL
ncbi:MAG: hypothetical protein WC900_06450 [Oscillospiraceae bacterium]|jgi:hypothetical protein